MFNLCTFFSSSLDLLIFDPIEMTDRGRRLESGSDQGQTGPVVGRGRGRVRCSSEIGFGGRASTEILREGA